MPKVSVEQANKLLAELGADVEVVADDKSADKDVAIDELHTGITEHLKGVFKPEIEANYSETAYNNNMGKLMNVLRLSTAKTFGIQKKELEDMKIEDIVNHAKAKYDERVGQSSQANEEEIKKMQDAWEQELKEKEEDWTRQLTEANAKYESRDIKTAVMSMVEKLPRKGGDLDEQTEMFIARLHRDYVPKYNEATKSIDLFTKDGKPALNGTKSIKFDELGKEWADKAGILAKDTRDIPPKDVQNGNMGNYKTGVDEIKPDENGRRVNVNPATQIAKEWAEQGE